MAFLNSKQLWQERSRLAAEQASLADAGEADKALVIQGHIEQLDMTLEHVLDMENELRDAPKPQPKAQSFGVRILGARDEFNGLPIGFKSAAVRSVRNAEGDDPTVMTVGAPTEIELELPAKRESVFQTFADTLLETPALGSVTYKQRSAQTGAPETWGGVTDGNSATKAQVLYSFKDAVANKETIAGYVPVSKDTLMDYDELLDIIQHDLLLDLDEKTNAKYWSGNSSTGIVGITNTTGIQTFSEAMAGMYYDAIRMMRTKVMMNARTIPTHVAVNPLIKEAIDLYRTENGLYQALGNWYWGMVPVEDPDCPGIMVYDSYAARRRAIHGGTTVEVGYYNDQFIKNELSLLAEHTKALQVRRPDAFCYATKADLDKTPTVSGGGTQ